MRPYHLLFILIPLASCSGDGDSLTPPEAGTLEVTTVTTGPQPDVDGYTISIDGALRGPIGASATLQLGDLEPGEHALQIGGLAENCFLTGENPRTVSITSRQSTQVSFQVTCLGTLGSLEVIAVTSGSPEDADGYILALDGKDRLRIDPNGTATFGGLTPGGHSVGLGDIAANCQLQGENPRPVAVTGGTTRTVTFAISCTS